MPFGANVKVWTERSQYSQASGTSVANTPVLQGVLATYIAPAAPDQHALPEGSLVQDFELRMDYGVDIIDEDVISQMTELDGVTLVAQSPLNPNEYLRVVHARDRSPLFLPHRRVLVRQATGGGQVY